MENKFNEQVNLDGLPEEVQSIIQHLSNTIYIMDEKMVNEKVYGDFLEEINNMLKAGFEHKALRECKVYFKFHEDSDILFMQLRHFLTNLIFWEPLIELESVNKLDESYLVETDKISAGYIKDYIDSKIVIPYRRKLSNKKLNMVIHNLIYNLSRISNDFNILLGLTMNIETFMDVANKNERFNEIIRTKLDPSLQPSEIEQKLDELMHEEIEILKSTDNALRPMLMSGTGIKHKQLSELSINGGLNYKLTLNLSNCGKLSLGYNY